jgi:hypothetical protein
MQQLEARDRAPLRTTAQHVHGCFDFGKLRHWTFGREYETHVSGTLTSLV